MSEMTTNDIGTTTRSRCANAHLAGPDGDPPASLADATASPAVTIDPKFRSFDQADRYRRAAARIGGVAGDAVRRLPAARNEYQESCE